MKAFTNIGFNQIYAFLFAVKRYLCHMANSGDLSVGSFIRFNGEICQITDYIHRTPGNLRAFYQAKMKNISNGKAVENRFRTGEDVELLRIETSEMQYLYQDGDNFVCMNNETFEQIPIPKQLFGNSAQFLSEDMPVLVSFDEDTPVMAEGPKYVVLEITYTEPGVKGDTATNTLKPATLENGVEIRVPLFVNTDDKIKVETATGNYVERAN